MFKVKNKKQTRTVVRQRIRRKLHGTATRPRLAVFRSSRHIYAQAVDDERGHTLVSASSLDPEVRGSEGYGGNTATAKVVGEKIAERLLATGLEQVVFDRGGYIFHGRVKALAEAVRAKGLKF